MRILLATEGRSDEVVARRLIERYFGEVTLHLKDLPARGIPVIRRLVSDFVRAGHFGHYDLLVVHFDMDDTLPYNFTGPEQSKRWRKVKSRAETTLKSLQQAHRSSELKIVLMTPNQATEAWLSWGRENESGATWERKDRHALKRKLFGDPPRGVAAKAEVLADQLITQMQANDDWPVTLRWFVHELTAGGHSSESAEGADTGSQ